jgi:hypothetical protein
MPAWAEVFTRAQSLSTGAAVGTFFKADEGDKGDEGDRFAIRPGQRRFELDYGLALSKGVLADLFDEPMIEGGSTADVPPRSPAAMTAHSLHPPGSR